MPGRKLLARHASFVPHGVLTPFRSAQTDLTLRKHVCSYDPHPAEPKGITKDCEIADDTTTLPADTYGIEIPPGHDDALILTITVCLDAHHS